eukprot:GILI01014752.1.p1 GENE.GILI01014752.1~~GILI01014752.1.p1  ORF type:complete len:403 (-),score=76.22 GILI01014752.1:81-1289(-)
MSSQSSRASSADDRPSARKTANDSPPKSTKPTPRQLPANVSDTSSPSASQRHDAPEVTSNTTAEGRRVSTSSPSISRGPSASRRSGVETDATSKSSGPTPRSRRASATDGIPSDQAPLTPEERGKWKSSEAENKRLVQKLAELNASLDKQLSKQGINVPSRIAVGSGASVASGVTPEVDKCRQRIEVLRKTNGEMQKALKEHNSVRGSGFDLRNKHSQLVKTLEHLRSENQSLENVNTNQSSRTAQEDKVQTEIQRMRSEHNDVQRESREAIRQLKELRESEMINLRMLLKQQDLINEKLRFIAEESAGQAKGSPADAAPTTGKYALPSSVKKKYDISELQLVLQSLINEEADIQKDISNLTTRTIKAKWKGVADRKGAELEDLKDELALLKEHAEAKKIAI